MTNRVIKISLVVTLSLLLMFLIISLIVLLNRNDVSFDFFNNNSVVLKKEEYNLEDISKINIVSYSTDIKIISTNDNIIKVNVYGNKDDDVSLELINGELSLNYSKNTPCIGFCFEDKFIEIVIPNNYDSDLNVESKSGNINSDSLNVQLLQIKSNSGDIDIKDYNKVDVSSESGNIKLGTVNYLDIGTTSGDIEVDRINYYIKVETNSGEVDIDSLVLGANSSISTSSGDININNINDIYVEASTRSGDIEIKNNNRMAAVILKLVTKSGNIEVN